MEVGKHRLLVQIYSQRILDTCNLMSVAVVYGRFNPCVRRFETVAEEE